MKDSSVCFNCVWAIQISFDGLYTSINYCEKQSLENNQCEYYATKESVEVRKQSCKNDKE